MWHKRLLASDSEQGFKQWYWSNPDTGEVALQSEWEVGHIAETAKGIYNTFDERAGWKGDRHHVGWIPQQVLEHMFKQLLETLSILQ